MLHETGKISMSDVNVELGKSNSSRTSLNDSDVRSLAEKPSGQIDMDDLHGKSSDPFAQKYGPAYKGKYDKSKSYAIGDIVSQSGLEEGLAFEVTIPYNREDPNLKEFQKVYKINKDMAFKKVSNTYWDILFDNAENIDFHTTSMFVNSSGATTQQYSSTADNYFPYNKIRCVTLRENGTENYELSFEDRTKKKDGAPANLTGADGNVVVRIPKFYGEVYANASGDRRYRVYNYENPKGKLPLGVKVHPYFHHPKGGYYDARYEACYFGSLNSSNQLVSISGSKELNNVTISQSLNYARQGRNYNYNIRDFLTWSTIYFLYIIEYAHMNSQLTIGQGKGYCYTNTTGVTDKLGCRSGNVNNRPNYRGMEDLISSGLEWLVGFNTQNQYFYYTNNPEYYLNQSKKTQYNSNNSGNPYGYIKNVYNISGIEELLIPKEKSASNSTYYCDDFSIYWSYSDARFAQACNYDGDDRGGLASLDVGGRASASYSSYGCRLSFCKYQ